MRKNKNLLLACFCQIAVVPTLFAINLIIDDSATNSDITFNISQDIDYDIASKSIAVMTSDALTNDNIPYLCLGPISPEPSVSLMSPSQDSFRILGKAGVSTAIYNISVDSTFNITTDATTQCVVKGYFQEVAIPDSIFASGFEVPLLNRLGTGADVVRLSILDFPTTLIGGRSFSYRYQLTNFTNQIVTVDLGEYYLHTNSNTIPHFSSNPGDFSRVCSPASACTDNNTPNNYVHEQGITIAANGTVDITVTRLAVVDVDTTTKIDLLATALVTSDSDGDLLNNSDTIQFNASTNSPPTFTTTFADIAILEDTPTSIINFSIDDLETANASLTLSALSSNTTVAPVNNIVFAGSGSNRTLQITPSADANTASGAITISILVNDGISSTQQQFILTVTPVNDAPTFTLMNLPDFSAGSAGLQQTKGFMTITSFGGSDENTQALTGNTLTLISDPNGILTGLPLLSNNGVLSYILAGNGGTATISVVMQDNGGMANGGVDLSLPIEFTITVLNTIPTVLLNNASDSAITINEDNTSSAIAVTLADAESSLDCADLSATSSDPSMVASNGVSFSGTGTACTVTINPATNQNTAVSGPVIVSIIVNDGSDDSLPLDIALTISPINDAPSFSLMPNITWPVSTTGLKLQTGYAFDLIMGPTADESSQSPNTPEGFVLTTSGAAIFSSTPTVDNSGSLAYVLNGTSGTATIQITLQDDGGVANGGVDLSALQTFTITVL